MYRFNVPGVIYLFSVLLLAGLCLTWTAGSEAAAFSASAGGNQTVPINQTVTLTGSASNASGGVQRWYWQLLSGPGKLALNTSISSPTASFTSPTSPGAYIFMLTVTDASNANAYAVTSVTVVNKPPVITLTSKNFGANQTISNGQTQTLNWTVRNDSGFDLPNVIVTPNSGNGGLSYNTISPNGLASWAAGASITFSVSVNAPANLPAGVYTQNWSVTYNGGQVLPFSNTSDSISYTLTVPQNILLTPTANTLNGNAYQDNTILAPGAFTLLHWSIRNDSNINLSNVSLSPGVAVGNLVIGIMRPIDITNWPIGVTKNFNLTVVSPVSAPPGLNSQNWSFNYNGKQIAAIGFKLNSPSVSLTLQNSYFTADNSPLVDGKVIPQGSSATINWVIQNNSSTALTNVTLSPVSTVNISDQFTIGAISPSSIANWGVNENKTFAVTVNAAANAVSGRHSVRWGIFSDGSLANNQLLSFSLTTSPLQCGIEANPQPAIPSLTKIDNSGFSQAGSYSPWACVADSSSGLEWEVKTQDGGVRDYTRTYNWHAAQTYVNTVNALTLCGKNDWRLPSTEELLTLVNAKPSVSGNYPQRIINTDFFPNTQTDDYWSASDSAAKNAWGVSFANGAYVLLDETAAHYVRLVRNTP